MAGKIEQWSFSRWDTYRSCPAKAKYKFIDRLPDPSGPAAARGDEIHKAAEAYVQKRVGSLPAGLQAFKPLLKALRDDASTLCEEELALSDGFMSHTGWFDKDAWCRAKLDVLQPETSEGARIIDYKTGKVYAEKHELQAELYALFGLLLYSDRVVVEFWYTDIGVDMTARKVYGEGENTLSKLKKKWLTRAKPMLTDTVFRPRPNKNCVYCSFSKKKGGPCKY